MRIERTILATSWGWVGLAGYGSAVKALTLPTSTRHTAYDRLNSLLAHASTCENPDLLPHLRSQLRDYFAGARIDQWHAEIDLEGYSDFARLVLTAAQTVPYGETISYGQLAERVGRAGAARAVGRVMKINRIPILVPCHRIVGSKGWGGFSGENGVAGKIALLRLEGLISTEHIPDCLL